MRYSLIFLALLGCTTAAPLPAPVPEPAQDTCNAGTYRDLVGQPATALERVMLLGQVRVIRPDTAVTMDFRPDRINFMIDLGETITSIRCG